MLHVELTGTLERYVNVRITGGPMLCSLTTFIQLRFMTRVIQQPGS